MSVCPFCKASVAAAHGTCPTCGRHASEHPSLQQQGHTLGGGWDDEDLALGSATPDLALPGSRGAPAASAYSGGGLSLGDDDDPFAEDVPAGALELDLPAAHTAHTSGTSRNPGPPTSLSPSAVPDLDVPRRMSGAIAAVNVPGAPSPNVSAPPPSQPSLPIPPARTEPDPPPASGQFAPPPSSGRGAPPSSSGQPVAPPPAPAPPTPAAPQTPDPAALIARYPPAPAKVWETPGYAVRVLLRQMELRQDLASLRRRRSPDVPLYERALQTHDAKTFSIGLAITCAGIALASFVFFLPVILRFLRAPD